MAWTTTDLDALKAAIGQGATRVRFADRDVTYRSLDEMRETMRLIEADIAEVAGVTRRAPRQVRFITTKGLR